jgi:hypothetical protein
MVIATLCEKEGEKSVALTINLQVLLYSFFEYNYTCSILLIFVVPNCLVFRAYLSMHHGIRSGSGRIRKSLFSSLPSRTVRRRHHLPPTTIHCYFTASSPRSPRSASISTPLFGAYAVQSNPASLDDLASFTQNLCSVHTPCSVFSRLFFEASTGSQTRLLCSVPTPCIAF